MTAEVLGVPYEFKKCDLMAGENMKVEIIQLICFLFSCYNYVGARTDPKRVPNLGTGSL